MSTSKIYKYPFREVVNIAVFRDDTYDTFVHIHICMRIMIISTFSHEKCLISDHIFHCVNYFKDDFCLLFCFFNLYIIK